MLKLKMMKMIYNFKLKYSIFCTKNEKKAKATGDIQKPNTRSLLTTRGGNKYLKCKTLIN